MSNILILIVLHKVSSLHTPTKMLFRCLAVTDLCVGLLSQPLFATTMLTAVKEMNVNTVHYITEIDYASSFILCGVSIFTSTATSVDRLLALSLRLRYRYVVTLRRVCAFISCFWLTAISGGFIYLFWNARIAFIAATACLIPSVLISVFSYTKIFFKLRQHQTQVQDYVHQRQTNEAEILLNIARYKKTVSSGTSAFFVWKSATTLTFLNSSLNPILYCWKIIEVRQAMRDTIILFFIELAPFSLGGWGVGRLVESARADFKR